MKNVVTNVGRLLAVSVAMAALAGLPSALAQSSYDAPSIQKRIERSGELQRQALRTLGDPPRAEQLVRRAYAELQAAQSAMIIGASGQKFPDPLLEMNTRRTQEALILLQRAADTLRIDHGSGQGQRPAEGSPERPARSQASLDAVKSNIEQALRLTGTVLVF
ncbi:MAG TPA: hypothetical protein VIE41_21335 [Methylomirabilota bacterium]